MLRWAFRLACAAALAAGLAWLPYCLSRSDGWQQLRGMRAQLGDLDKGNQELREQNKALRREVIRLRGDFDAIAAVARDELGMVQPGDVVVQIERGSIP